MERAKTHEDLPARRSTRQTAAHDQHEHRGTESHQARDLPLHDAHHSLPGRGRPSVRPDPPTRAAAPIGVGGVDFSSVELPAAPGSALLLYTDGLVETRSRSVDTGLELLRGQLEGIPQLSPGNLCQGALTIAPADHQGDDIALLAAVFDGIPAEDVAFWHLQPRHETPYRARRLAAQTLRRWGFEGGLADDTVGRPADTRAGCGGPAKCGATTGPSGRPAPCRPAPDRCSSPWCGTARGTGGTSRRPAPAPW
ncbi:SpoIIE family protein phosphatase [Kitasatospora aureofaciens]|uniref:SpoIIE family protein phosphatase n=1 Tax=Kitasatospora aureofaciens TaxID=1894 RepID=UPI0009969FAE|nr:SpoIIE family protein phosphatase [Kitasatospora aureofaciens]